MEQKQTYPIVLHFLIVPTDKDRLLSVNYLNFKRKEDAIFDIAPAYISAQSRPSFGTFFGTFVDSGCVKKKMFSFTCCCFPSFVCT